MTKVTFLTYNPFQQNTYIVYDDSKECVIIDPGCYAPEEEQSLVDFVEKEGLTPVRLLNTHCHLDHICGNKFIAEKYNLGVEIPKEEKMVLEMAPAVGKMYGFEIIPSPEPSKLLLEDDTIEFGNTKLSIIFTPGHSPGGFCFYCKEANFIITPDVLFKGSVGRTDLPGGDYRTLMESIKNKIIPLGNDLVVYSGHGPATTIGEERIHNHFAHEWR